MEGPRDGTVAIEHILHEVRSTLDVGGMVAMRLLCRELHGEFEREGPMHLRRQRQKSFVGYECGL